MSKLTLIISAFVVISLTAGAIALAQWDIPAPQQKVQKVLPDDKFPK